MGLLKFLKEKFSKNKTQDSENYVKGMEKSRENFANKMDKIAKKSRKVNEEYFGELEEILIEADVGVNLTMKVLEEVASESIKNKITDAEEINELVIDKLFSGYMSKGEEIQAEHRESVSYELIGESGPAHDKRFRVRVLFDGIELGTGEGSTKKEAEQQAAKAALEKEASK